MKDFACVLELKVYTAWFNICYLMQWDSDICKYDKASKYFSVLNPKYKFKAILMSLFFPALYWTVQLIFCENLFGIQSFTYKQASNAAAFYLKAN